MLTSGLLVGGIILFVLSTIAGIYFIQIQSSGAIISEYLRIPMLINFAVWIASIVMIVLGVKRQRNSSKRKTDEIKNLKDRISDLEKNKNKNDKKEIITNYNLQFR